VPCRDVDRLAHLKVPVWGRSNHMGGVVSLGAEVAVREISPEFWQGVVPNDHLDLVVGPIEGLAVEGGRTVQL